MLSQEIERLSARVQEKSDDYENYFQKYNQKN